MEILFQATDLAIEKRMSKLSQRLLEAVYRDSGIDDKDNWFKMEVPELLRKFAKTSEKAAAGTEREAQPSAAGSRRRRRSRNNPLARKR
jgi:hypothetical protein